jgi:hypothetical protein
MLFKNSGKSVNIPRISSNISAIVVPLTGEPGFSIKRGGTLSKSASVVGKKYAGMKLLRATLLKIAGLLGISDVLKKGAGRCALRVAAS